MDNLRKFSNENNYSAATLAAPAVSWVVSGNTVHYDKDGKTPPTPTPTPPTPPSMRGNIKLTYYINNISNPTLLFKGGGSGSGSGSGSGGFVPQQMWIDGVEISPTNEYTFSTRGYHTVELNTGSDDCPSIFGEIYEINAVQLGSSIRRVQTSAFEGCSNLSEIIFETDTYINERCFYNISENPKTITCYSNTPPTLASYDCFPSLNYDKVYIPFDALNNYKSSSWKYDYDAKFYAIPT